MRWPWSKREQKLPEGVTVLDVRGAQLIVLRHQAQLSRAMAEHIREQLRVVLAGTALEGVKVLVLSGGTELSVITSKVA